MENFEDFLSKLGSLHDCAIHRIEWQPLNHIVEMEIEDLYANFKGLPEYRGPTQGIIKLKGVAGIETKLGVSNHPRFVYEVLVKKTENLVVSIHFWPSGSIDIICQNVEFPSL